MNILLTFTGFHDPYSKSLIEGEEQPGPILSLLKCRLFEHVFLFNTPATINHSENTKEAIYSLYPKCKVHILDMNLLDPTSYKDIFSSLKHHVQGILENFKSASFFISVASGTPQMHACWMLLAASGEIPAKILHVRPPRFVTKNFPLVSEIDLSSEEFPDVRFIRSSKFHIDQQEIDANSVRMHLGIVGDHPRFLKVLEMGAALAIHQRPILLTGETGTGKELFAQYIHTLSKRPNNTFIAVNCACIPKDIIESYLFGHKKGAFTGAIEDQKGKFDSAHNGTLFLDELGEMSLLAQAKLLRVLDDGIVGPLGATKGHKVNVRIIAATNRDLYEEIQNGNFRKDLYHRLTFGEIKLPSLRERRSDIPKLALHLLDQVNNTIKNPRRLTVAALKRLQDHNWEGNIRDLRNVIDRSVMLNNSLTLDSSDLLIKEPTTSTDLWNALPGPFEGFSLNKFLDDARKQLMLRALDLADGNQSKAAKILGLTPQAINKELNKLKRKISTSV
ncbi:MAG: sigma 54-interacting transcriptional regulator [Oligoflexia bacterium]|nr:sigma 54-interacting transcriptional regulator [Oligoflexia bacterium]